MKLHTKCQTASSVVSHKKTFKVFISKIYFSLSDLDMQRIGTIFKRGLYKDHSLLPSLVKSQPVVEQLLATDDRQPTIAIAHIESMVHVNSK